MDELSKACAVAVERQQKAYGVKSKATKIRRIGETSDLFIFSFFSEHDSVECGGGGLIVYKKDYSVDFYCIPSYPKNIFEVIDNAIDVEIPKEYA